MDDIEIPPLRSLDDFIKESARFSAPALGNPTRWANRVIDNLLYYQSNYFLTLIVIFLIVGCINPVQMLWGLAIVIAAFFGFGYWSANKREVNDFKKAHPVICLIALCLVIWLFMYLFGSFLVLIWGLAAPAAVIFIHASLRMRNMKNKMSKKLESLGLKRTPMGIILFTIGLEEQARS
ncbi:PRA1 family protein 2-like [Lytechinus variegatus]|uniref:PRA1 family protein 2-like n=1 Tax=Lytechinus variegatus TaxID=7654 RepID=UPI001BB150C9|nr:PRA1 family protein 2-like [Lytechinus variegatus]